MKLTLKHGHPRMCLARFATWSKALFSDATNLIYYFLYNHVATAINVSQGSYVARSSELVKRKQAHIVIEIYH